MEDPVADPDPGDEVAEERRQRPQPEQDPEADRCADDGDEQRDHDHHRDEDPGDAPQQGMPGLVADQAFRGPDLTRTEGGQQQAGRDRREDEPDPEQEDGGGEDQADPGQIEADITHGPLDLRAAGLGDG